MKLVYDEVKGTAMWVNLPMISALRAGCVTMILYKLNIALPYESWDRFIFPIDVYILSF